MVWKFETHFKNNLSKKYKKRKKYIKIIYLCALLINAIIS